MLGLLSCCNQYNDIALSGRNPEASALPQPMHTESAYYFNNCFYAWALLIAVSTLLELPWRVPGRTAPTGGFVGMGGGVGEGWSRQARPIDLPRPR
jgi:hypothetical protein